jgi:hypothetical protein
LFEQLNVFKLFCTAQKNGKSSTLDRQATQGTQNNQKTPQRKSKYCAQQLGSEEVKKIEQAT